MIQTEDYLKAKQIVQEYEKQSLAKSANLDGDQLLADSLQRLDHVKKLEVLQGKIKMKQNENKISIIRCNYIFIFLFIKCIYEVCISSK